MHHSSSSVTNVTQWSFHRENEIQHLIRILNVHFKWKHYFKYERSLLPKSGRE